MCLPTKALYQVLTPVTFGTKVLDVSAQQRPP